MIKVSKFCALLLSMILVLVMMPLTALSVSSVKFPDPNMETAIRNAINKPTGDITPADVKGITKLDARDLEISNIEGLQNLSNLQELILCNNEISNINPLKGLSKLKLLDLTTNKVSNVSSLANLTKLTELSLFENKISDITVLGKLIGLKKLYLSKNNISNIKVLANFKKLTHLYLNEISDISVLDKLTELRELFLIDNKIGNIKPLSNLRKLTRLYLDSNNISDISTLSKLAELTNLDLESNRISDISALSRLTELTDLNLAKNRISDISALKNLIKLKTLYLKDNPISEYTPVSAIYGTLELKDFTIDSPQGGDSDKYEITVEREYSENGRLSKAYYYLDGSNAARFSGGIGGIVNGDGWYIATTYHVSSSYEYWHPDSLYIRSEDKTYYDIAFSDTWKSDPFIVKNNSAPVISYIVDEFLALEAKYKAN